MELRSKYLEIDYDWYEWRFYLDIVYKKPVEKTRGQGITRALYTRKSFTFALDWFRYTLRNDEYINEEETGGM